MHPNPLPVTAKARSQHEPNGSELAGTSRPSYATQLRDAFIGRARVCDTTILGADWLPRMSQRMYSNAAIHAAVGERQFMCVCCAIYFLIVQILIIILGQPCANRKKAHQ